MEYLKHMFKSSNFWLIWGAISLFTLIFILFFNFHSHQTKPQTGSQKTATIPLNSPSPNITYWKLYQYQDYALSYPPDLTVTPTQIKGGGNGLIFNFPPGKNYYLDLEVLNRATNSLSSISNTFNNFQFSENTVSVNNQLVTVFSGSMLVGNKTMQETAALLENSNHLFKLELNYFGDSRNQEADQLFSQILASLYLSH